MKAMILTICLLFAAWGNKLTAQTLQPEVLDAVKADDAVMLNKMIVKEKVNDCFKGYSLLSHAVRFNAQKCFDLLLEKGANVNQICSGYIPPLMHAAKYGRLEMTKTLVAKGAKADYMYDGAIAELKGMTPLKYAEAFKRTEVAAYLKGIEKNPVN